MERSGALRLVRERDDTVQGQIAEILDVEPVPLSSGKLLWSYRRDPAYDDVVIATPIFHDGQVFLSSNYGVGCALVRLRPGAPPEQVYRSLAMQNHFATCVLFEGHLYGFNNDRLRCLETNLVANVLPVIDQEELIADLSRVSHLIQSGNPLTPEEHLLPGRPVTIRHGPLAGLEGKIQRRANGWKLLIEVRMLQRGVSVELEEWMIEPLGRPAPAVAAVAG